jgi:hypothetical protein
VDVYFIGIRIRHGVEITKDEIDLTGTRQRFFEQINELLAMKQNPYIEDLVENQKVDIKVEYRHRNELPIEVRPK